ncbi:MAG: ubiquitin-conjugating enzyme E2 [Burkholderiaceae bacterium]|nr:ubiquitin-conjugating enzyme E2 [Burkholderiaceae bacterium]
MAASGSAHALRRKADIERLRELAAGSDGRLRLLEATDRPGRPIRLAVACSTAATRAYPESRQEGVTLRIDLPSRYPFERPVVTVETPIFHPNVFASGVVCQGERWLPGEGFDIFVRRMIGLVTFAPGTVNPASAANREAAAWYLQQRARTPAAFPTDRLDFGAGAPSRVVRHCPACAKGLRLPAGKRGVVACPACGHEFDVAT